MKKAAANRYEINDRGQIVIDISVPSVEHLYHDFDKTAPYYRKELDQEFVDYLIECVSEIGKSPFIIRMSLEKMPDEKLMDRVRKSINSYYLYLKEIELRSTKQMFRRFIILFAVGVTVLVLAILANRRLFFYQGVIAEVFAQGLTIAAWVSLWEAIVYIFVERQPHKVNIRLYDRILDAQILFNLLSCHGTPSKN
ncbi:MAG: hypothetical protein JRE63_04610 [Deltaproteobacteria bacterium]|jgi:hypothetical protein|nr:hypothetical protein [Deltaproteobacteria bacterium]